MARQSAEKGVTMDIIVCVKHVPDTESRIKLNDEGTWHQHQL